MNSQNKSLGRTVVSYIAIGGVIGFVAAGCLPLLGPETVKASSVVPATSYSTQSGSIVRNVLLSYRIQTSPTGTSGAKALDVDSITFYQNYVMVKEASGRTSLLPVDRLIEFTYVPAG